MSVPPPVPLNERLRFVVLSMALLAVLILAVYASVFDAADAHKTRPPFGQEDALMGARCEARCWTNKTPCVKLCLQKALTKPGLCPKRETLLSPFDAVCLTTCSQDSQCPGLAKCCRHSCGVTCQDPDHLSSATGIPEVPRNVRVTETVKKRSILIEWSSDEEPPSGSVIYVIEERHHAGRNFIEEHLSEWTPCARTNASGYTLKNLVKPGRWYQFRVAAVNENGTKGFSKTSPTFGASSRPKPPKAPQNVTVSALWSDANGTLFGEIRWLPPHSDLPIQRYKIFWSRRLHGAKALDSVLVHQQVVSKDRTRFLLEDLQPNSLYFLQIQALVQFGKNRLKGQKSGLVLNTTNYTNVSD
ncbi:anosmin-1 isoform X3 [Tenebrio molitor]|uniref:anosmin-1 isoform X3 n=1 Tax=Tenebrio molitor TaxID=7067 RepID=UPI00362474DE